MNKNSNTLTQKELDEFLEQTPEFIEETKRSLEYSIHGAEDENIKKSLKAINNGLIHCNELCIAILSFLQKCKSGVVGNSSTEISNKLTLIVAYFQGIHHTEDHILRGQYIGASALMKKDFEIMTRLREIGEGKAKEGRNPNAKYAPQKIRFVYGQLNDIAHISKSHVLDYYLVIENKQNQAGATSTPQFKKEECISFYSYHITISQVVISEAIGLHGKMYGIDEDYKNAMAYFKILNSVIEDVSKEIIGDKED